MMIFDSHAHLIADDGDRYAPAPLSGRLRPGDLDDPVTAERLLRLMDAQGVERAMVVQRAHVYGYDNSYVTDSAARYPDRLAAVVAIDSQDVRAPEHIRHWVSERGASGIRLAAVKPDAGETAWFTPETALPVWQAAAELGTSICVHIFRPQRLVVLGVLKQMLVRFPQVRVVVDHFANMAIEEPAPDYGFDALLSEIAAFSSAFIKFSTINLARLDEHGLPAAPVLARVIQAFGADRVMWGSDIGQSKGDYPQMVEMAQRAVAEFDPPVREKLMRCACAMVYGRV